MNPRERVDRALRGEDVDRPPFTFWHHFGLENEPGARHAEATLDFHRKFRTDIVKVMSDYPYPRPKGQWHELTVEQNPFPAQLEALDMIRDALNGRVHFVETIFNPWNQAEKLSSKEEVRRLKEEDPERLLAALRVIAESEASHARKAVAAGASGVFLAVGNAQEGILTREEYATFSEFFDRLVLDAVSFAPLNILHVHGEKPYLDLFLKNWPATAVNYSIHATGVPLEDVRTSYPGVIMGGIDEIEFRGLGHAELKRQADAARRVAGTRFILAPGCSVPDPSTDEELRRLPDMLGA
jgi:uroporphyrinogen decarboxylase